MIFTSFEFVAFFLAVLLFRSALTGFRSEKWFLLVASYVFYMSWSVPCVSLILLTSGIDYWVGLQLGRTDAPGKRRTLLVVSIVLNLGVLAFFKYTNFLLNTAWSTLSLTGAKLEPVHLEILLPVGISFFTFQSMSYTIDVYRRRLQPCQSLRDFFLFVAFFPQLVAGPIVRASEFLPQLAQRTRASAGDIERGMVLFLMGVLKKTVLSDQVAGHVDLIFADPSGFDAVSLVWGVLGYAVQIYCDFSGYTDMAIGCARIMGYRFPENFQMPYSSANITEFWRRWHMSLSTWLRDYLYIPLGGNRKGTRRTYVNLMLTMLLGGLWHGASWNFIIWGGIHGAALAFHKMWTTKFPPARTPTTSIGKLWRTASHAMTLGVVLVGWVFFRAQTLDAAVDFIRRMVFWQDGGTRLISPQIVAAVSVVLLAHLFVSKDRNWVDEITNKTVPIRIVAYSALTTIIVLFGATDAAPFIYFQF
jgi:alginate O-acetyltransferase complex protein AlgI